MKSPNTSVGIATGRTAEVQFLAEERDFSLLHSVQTGSAAHLSSYPMGTVGFFPGAKAAGAWSESLTSI
jgi:hypothetical protein